MVAEKLPAAAEALFARTGFVITPATVEIELPAITKAAAFRALPVAPVNLVIEVAIDGITADGWALRTSGLYMARPTEAAIKIIVDAGFAGPVPTLVISALTQILQRHAKGTPLAQCVSDPHVLQRLALYRPGVR
jgi:hypothetical protein